MPTIGHLAVGMAAGRLLARNREEVRPLMAVGTLLAIAPDFDLLGTLLGVGPESVWVHRGVTHSLAAAVLLGGIVGYGLAGRLGQGWAFRLVIWAIAVAGSHGLLDILNRDSKVALLWPFSSAFLSFPWQPIPTVENLGDLFGSIGLPILRSELLIFSPLFLLAFWPARPGEASQKVEDPGS